MNSSPILDLQARRSDRTYGGSTVAYEITTSDCKPVGLVWAPPPGEVEIAYDPKKVADLFVASPELLEGVRMAIEEIALILETGTINRNELENSYARLDDVISLTEVGRA